MPKIGQCGRRLSLAQRTSAPKRGQYHEPLVCGISRRLDCRRCLEDRISYHELTNPSESAEDRWELLCRDWPPLRRAERWRKNWSEQEQDQLPRTPRPEVLGAIFWA